ncbi:MAG: helix-hairpin-helix domain-containing protein [Flavobacteriales bacterium]|nr:helix-hairpin-helix domain-containing protein [Flavobacteriales bacterium]
MSNFKDYFTFDKRQRNGVVILLLLIVFTVVSRLSLPYLYQKNSIDSSDFEERIQEFEASAENKEPYKSKYTKQEITFFDFNPNNLSKEKWILLGLKEWQVKVIHNYESKGGSFRTKADVKKIYGIKEELYNLLEPYIKVPESESKKGKKEYKNELTLFQFNPNNLPEEKWKMLGLKDWQIKIIYNYESKGGQFRTKEDVGKIYGIKPELYEKWKPYIIINKRIGEKEEIMYSDKTNEDKEQNIQKIEINVADSLLLVSIYGIGPVYAKRILTYRYRLGGFRDLQQLKEVYGITGENYPKIVERLRVDTAEVIKININTAIWKILVRHPYIDKNVANGIINYRKQHGHYNTVADIKRSDLVNEELYRKIAPYLKIE